MADMSIEQAQSEMGLLRPGMYSDEKFRELLEMCGKAARIYITRKLSDVPLAIRIPALLVALERPDYGLVSETTRLMNAVPIEEREQIVTALLDSTKEHQQLIGVDLAREFKLTNFLQQLHRRWAKSSTPIRCGIVQCLASFGTPRSEELIVGYLGREKDAKVLAKMLEVLHHFKHANKPKLFERFLNHENAEVRLQSAKGLSIFGLAKQMPRLRARLHVEENYRIRDLLMTAIRPHANQEYADELLDWAVSHEDSELNSLATLQFRQLPDDLIYNSCKKALEMGDERHQIFGVTELGYQETLESGALLREVAGDREQSPLLRGAAVEGLSHHHHVDVRQFLVDLFSREAEDPLLGYQICLTLIKLWGQNDMPTIASFLRLQEPDFSFHIQTVLSFLAKKLKARKLDIPNEVVSLVHNLLDSENANIQMLSLEVLSYQPDATDLARVMTLAHALQSEEADAMLQTLVGTTIARSPGAFAECITDPTRSDADRILALKGCAQAFGNQDGLAAAFMALCAAALSLPESAADAHQAALRHLAANEPIRTAVAQTLAGWNDDAFGGFWTSTRFLPPEQLEEMIPQEIMKRVQSHSPLLQLEAAQTLSRLPTNWAKDVVMEFYFAHPEHRKKLAVAIQAAIRESA